MILASGPLKAAGIVDQEHGCVYHTLQNAVKNAFKATPVVKKAKMLCMHLPKSTQAKNNLTAACQKVGHKFRMVTRLSFEVFSLGKTFDFF